MVEEVKKTYFNSFPPAGITPAGSPIADIMQWNKDQTALVKVGERDIQKEINAAAVGVTPYELLATVLKTGDESLLSQNEGASGDFSGMPETMSDALKVQDQAEAASQDPETLKALGLAPATAAASPAPALAASAEAAPKKEEVK